MNPTLRYALISSAGLLVGALVWDAIRPASSSPGRFRRALDVAAPAVIGSVAAAFLL